MTLRSVLWQIWQSLRWREKACILLWGAGAAVWWYAFAVLVLGSK